MTDLRIPDISEFQGDVDWAAFKAANSACIVRAHNGWREDYKWSRNAPAVSTLPWWGAYQYLPAAVDPVKARYAFDASLGKYRPNVVILDHEEGSGDQSAREQAWMLASNPPEPEVLYSGLYFMRTHLAHVPVSELRWIAAYQNLEPTDHHFLWQYTDKFKFAGIANPCDASVFHGTIQQLILATGGMETLMALDAADISAIAVAVWARFLPEGENLPTMVAQIHDAVVGPAPAHDTPNLLAKLPVGSANVAIDYTQLAAAMIDALKAHPLAPSG